MLPLDDILEIKYYAIESKSCSGLRLINMQARRGGIGMFFHSFLANMMNSGGEEYCKKGARQSVSNDNCQKVLSTALCGDDLKIIKINGCNKAVARLRSMGLNLHDEIVVLNNSGPIIVAKGPSRIALGKCLADKVITCPVISLAR